MATPPKPHPASATALSAKGGPPAEQTVAAPVSVFSCMKGTFKITGDIVGPEPDTWEAMLN